ncbi:MAG: hypothetical protein RR461_02285, partial [Angelakisella sp.]
MIKRYITIGAVVLLLMGVVLFSLTPTSIKVGDAIIISLCAGSGGTVIDISPDIHEANTQITIQATANPGYCFDRWTTSTGGNLADKFSTHTTFTVPKQSATITAHFKPIEDGSPAYYLTVTVGEGGTIPAGLGNRING